MKEIRVSRYHIQFLLIPIIIFIFLTFASSQLFSQPLVEGHDKFLGSVYGNNGAGAYFDNYWNQITPENSGKWGNVETGRDIYTWNGLDAAYFYALDREFPFKLHTLIWGQQQPFG